MVYSTRSPQKSPRQTESSCSTSGTTSTGPSVSTPFSTLRFLLAFYTQPHAGEARQAETRLRAFDDGKTSVHPYQAFHFSQAMRKTAT